ncbi:hypothetical protein K7X08_027222 [Anisodus acutangulus]|uniref:Uncharacterized protein n=1 Tax=Anisodus acutangulus TaxID=402998 RepID=A0A9Q1MNX0_9SOLA|nr:hypothetical protein K7X08_027222 [Anisodus acutangulus]
MDVAIEDGVDILSLSLGGSTKPFHDDAIALGAYSATEKGIFVSSSAGNKDPTPRSVGNEAPWILTVGASTLDRIIKATTVLGNKEEFQGESDFQPKDFPSTLSPLVYSGSNSSDINAPYCSTTSLNNTDLTGKIVLCEVGVGVTRVAKGQAVKAAGGVTMILMDHTVNLGNNTIQDENHEPANLFAIGAGHVNPSKANDPGFVYDIQPKDYVPYLCGLNYTNREVGIIVQQKTNCLEVGSIQQGQLNYPSFSIILGSTPQTYTRTVTNVGEASSSYTVDVVSPPGVDVKVEPTVLNFTELNQKMSYQVTFSQSANLSSTGDVEGFLKWKSTKYSVRSPIAAYLTRIF